MIAQQAQVKASSFITDYFEYPIDVERCYTMLTVREGAATYLPNLGINYQQFIESDVVFQNGAVASYIQQEAAKDGIAIASVDFSEENYTLNMHIGVLTTYGTEVFNIDTTG